MQNKKFITPGIIFIILLYCNSHAVAEGNIHFGAFKIHPFVSIEELYDDNIFLEPEGEENNDWITKIIMGVGLFMPLVPEREKDFTIKADYEGSLINYTDYQDENRIDHKASGQADFNFAEEIIIRLEDTYNKTADPATSENTELQNRFRNNAFISIGRQKEFIGLEFGYRNIRDDYSDLNNLDKYENIINTDLYFRTFSKTMLSIEGRFGNIKYDNNNTNSNSTSREIGIAIKGKLAPKTSGVVKGGYRQTKYEDENKADFKGFTAFCNITYKLKDSFVLNVFGERQPVESTYLTNSCFESNKIGLKMDVRFVYRFFFAIEGFYQVNRYPDRTTATEKRMDKFYGGNASLRYELKDTLIVKINYEYNNRDSNFSIFDYENNQYSGNITLIF